MAGSTPPQRRSQSGQAAVETAITMPLALFMVLGTLQLFMLLQGRLFAEHAAYMAVRTGVVRHGDCKAMTHAAILALLPNFTTFLGDGTPGNTPAEKLGNAFERRTRGQPFDNAFDPVLDDGHDRSIVWLFREQPRVGDVSAVSEQDFDRPGVVGGGNSGFKGPYRLEVRAVYWYPLRIPFANQVLATLFRAWFGIANYTRMNPLMPTQRANWTASGRTLTGLSTEFDLRFRASHYAFPITASYAMRMMTPPRPRLFKRQNCEPAP
jgi:hypothetical protein